VAASPIDPGTRPTGNRSGDRGDRGGRRVLVLAGIAAISIIGPLLLISQSPHGVHASPDSFTYLGAAANLVRGHGWTYAFGQTGAPVTLFPPLYPLLLAVPELLGVSSFDWVLWQNALLLGVLSFVVGITVLEATGGSLVASLLASLLVQLGTPTTTVYAHVWSEPLFYPTVVVLLASLGCYLATGRTRWLLIAAAASSVGMLTRYAGLSVFVTACLVLLAWPARSIRDRLRRTALFAVIALPLSAVWVIRNLATSGTLTGNNQLVHGLSAAEVVKGLGTIGSWFVPADALFVPADAGGGARLFLALFTASAVLLLLFLAYALIRSQRTDPIELRPVVAVSLVYAAIHFAFIVVANAYSTRSPPFNDRILGPAFAPMVIAVVVIGHAIWEAFGRGRSLQIVLLTLAGSLLALSVAAATVTMPAIYGSEQGTHPYYRGISRSLEDVIASRDILLSNRANIAWFLTGRAVASLPRSCFGGQVLPNPSYDEELRDLARSLADDPRQVIFFRRSPKCEPFSMEGLKAVLRLEQVGPRGPVFVLEGPSRSPG
jgi:4-amino-4-deoxy-L-arabinose transferase-like glycosyltransferase